MQQRVLLVDNTETVLRVKEKILKEAGFDVDAYRYPASALLTLAGSFNGSQHYAVVTDNDMPKLSGATLVTYLSPETDRNNELVTRVYFDVIRSRLYPSFEDHKKALGMCGVYRGKLVLTSREQLKPLAIDDDMPPAQRSAYAVHNEALRIARNFAIAEDGTGMEELIEYLRI